MSAAKKKSAAARQAGGKQAAPAGARKGAPGRGGFRPFADWSVPSSAAAALSRMLPSRAWRSTLAGLVAFLVVVSTTGGLVSRLPWLQIPIVAGIGAALVAGSIAGAGVASALGVALGFALGPVTPTVAMTVPVAVRLQQGLGGTAVAVVVAILARLLLDRRPGYAQALNWMAIAVIIGNLWATALVYNARPTFDAVNMRDKPSLNQQLAADEAAADVSNDQVMLWAVARTSAKGEPYYETYRRYFVQWSGKEPASATNIRFPLISYALGVLPGSSVAIVFLVAATLAALAPPVFARGFVKQPLALPAVGALASYFLFYATRMHLFTTEVWAALLGVASLTAYSISLRSPSRRGWVVASVVAAVVAVLVRETAVFILAAGVGAAVLVKAEDRRFDIAAWIAGSAIAAVALGVHYWVALSVVDPSSAYDQLGPGSFAWMYDGLVWATLNLGGFSWLAPLLAVLGLSGIVLIPSARLRWFALFATASTLVAFLFVANQGQQVGTGVSVNYWGTVVVPYLYLAIPMVFLLIPAAAVRSDGGGATGRGGRG